MALFHAVVFLIRENNFSVFLGHSSVIRSWILFLDVVLNVSHLIFCLYVEIIVHM